MTHDAANLFYADDNHPNKTGSAMINDLIVGKIKLIAAKQAQASTVR